MILYHGTDRASALDIEKAGIRLDRGRMRVDFGRGFYLTPDHATARQMAIRKAIPDEPYIVSIDFDERLARQNGWIKEFPDCDLRWAQFIINNRNGESYFKELADQDNNLSCQYHIIKGRIADGNISEISRTLAARKQAVTPSVLRAMVEHRYPDQYSLHTPEVLSLVRSIRIKEII